MAKDTLKIFHTARFLKYVWPFYNIMHEKVNVSLSFSLRQDTEARLLPSLQLRRFSGNPVE